MKRFFLALVMLTGNTAIGQHIDKEEALTRLPADFRPENGEKQCGDYFVATEKYYRGSGPGLVYKLGVIAIYYPKTSFRVVIDDTKKVPTARMVATLENGEKHSRIIIRISKRDHKTTKDCLPEPTPTLR